MNGAKTWLTVAAFGLVVVYVLRPSSPGEQSRLETHERLEPARLRRAGDVGTRNAGPKAYRARPPHGGATSRRARMADQLARLRGKPQAAGPDTKLAASKGAFVDAGNRVTIPDKPGRRTLPGKPPSPPDAATPGERRPPSDEIESPGEAQDLELLRQIAFGSEDPDERADAVRDIISGEWQIPRDTVREILKDPNPEVRAAAVEELAGAGDRVPVELFALVMSDRDPEARMGALEEIALSADPIPFEVLVLAIDDPDPSIRAAAASLISESEDPQVRSMLNYLLEDPDEDVRAEAESYVE